MVLFAQVHCMNLIQCEQWSGVGKLCMLGVGVSTGEQGQGQGQESGQKQVEKVGVEVSQEQGWDGKCWFQLLVAEKLFLKQNQRVFALVDMFLFALISYFYYCFCQEGFCDCGELGLQLVGSVKQKCYVRDKLIIFRVM
eukprot:TRINITY_DN1515_c0_g1_i1.p6 TRINITY_DN1515_c0_g1~~TRINITY_DN1515_c0_g1_i1.p6  ORF type:complete len:139 (+),score=9.40 TRINITY_DN1515_c0_g1_i1:1487-1903(+)